MAFDPFFDNVVYLNHFDGEHEATESPDESNSAHDVTLYLGLTTTEKVFGTAALSSGSTVAAPAVSPDSSDWSFGDGEFTIEFWGRPSNIAGNRYLISQWAGSGQQSWAIYFRSGDIRFLYSTTGSDTEQEWVEFGETLNTWYAFCIDRDSTGKIRLYVDGAMVGSIETTDTFFASTAPMTIGDNGDSSSPYYGQIDEVRITKGVARYASDSGYTVATEAFPAGALRARTRAMISSL